MTAQVESISTAINHGYTTTTIKLHGHSHINVGDTIIVDNRKGAKSMDPWEMELGRLKDDNNSMVAFLISAGLQGAYEVYRESVGLEPCELLAFHSYFTSDRLKRDSDGTA